MFDVLLNPEVEIDVELLNNLCIQARSGNQAANDLLVQLRNREDLHSIFNDVMSDAADEQTKMFVLQVINDFIKFKWNILTDEEKISLRDSIISYVTAYAPLDVTPGIKSLLNMAYASIVIILLPDAAMFEPLLVLEGVSEFHLFNNLQILTMIFEEIFEDEKVWLTSVQQNTGKLFVQNQAPQIFNYTIAALQASSEELILSRIFATYKYFINFIPLELLAQHDFFSMICQGYMQNSNFMPFILATIESIFNTDELPQELVGLIPSVFQTVTETAVQVIPPNDDFQFIDPDSGIKIIAEALKLFPSKYSELVEVEELAQHISVISQWMCAALNVEDIEVFRTCNEYWNAVLHRYADKKKPMVDGFKGVYNQVLPHVSRLLMQKMPRPPEVLIVVEQGGGIRRDTQKETLEAAIFQIVRQNLVLIAHIDIDDTLRALTELNDNITRHFDANMFSSMYWSVGAVSGTMKKDKERDFISGILLPLVTLCDGTRDENTRAIIAAGIMYICSQYPRFITLNMEFFHKIVFKLFDFMHQDVPGIREMAVATFNAIGKKAKVYFCNQPPQTNPNEPPPPPFVIEIIQHLNEILEPLEAPTLRASIYDTISNIANGSANQNFGSNVIRQLTNTLQGYLANGASYLNGNNAEMVQFALDCHRFIGINNPQLYMPTLSSLFDTFMSIYKSATQGAINCISETGNRLWMHSFIHIKTSVLLIFINIFGLYRKSPPNMQSFIEHMLRPLLETVVQDYLDTTDEGAFLMDGDQPEAEKQMRPPFLMMDLRVPEVLDLMTLVSTDIQGGIDEAVVDMFSRLVGATLPMLGQRNNYQSFALFRPALYKMIAGYTEALDLDAIGNHFDVLTLIDMIQRGEDHPGYDVSAPAFKAMAQMVAKLPTDSSTIEVFQSIFLHAFSTLTDATHKVVFDEQVNTLRNVVGYIKNIDGITPEVLSTWLVEASIFPNIDIGMTLDAVTMLMDVVEDADVFRRTIRDILVESKTFTPTDPELRMQEAEQLRVMAEEQVEHIPGIEGPAEVE